MSRGLGIVLIALGWALWAFGFVILLFCECFQSNPGIAAPGDPCGTLRWLVIGGFLFLLVASLLALASPRRSGQVSREALLDEEGRNPTQRRIDENRRRR